MLGVPPLGEGCALDGSDGRGSPSVIVHPTRVTAAASATAAVSELPATLERDRPIGDLIG
jgi:hypothetical protein